jgi:mRNA interferase RelE/StbE
MDKKAKFLNKIPTHDRVKILDAINRILVGDLVFLDIKKLKNTDNQFRVRVGNYRIQFTKYNESNQVTKVSHRSDNTYRD